MKIGYQLMSPCYDIVPMGPLFILNLCQLYVFFDIMELPVFVPNDYLYRTHIDKVTITSTNTEAPLVSLHSPGRESAKYANSEGPSFHAKSGEFKAVSQHDEISPAEIEIGGLPESMIRAAATNTTSPNQTVTVPEKWEVFAWAVRDVMSKASGLEKTEALYRDKLEYEEILGFRKPKQYSKV